MMSFNPKSSYEDKYYILWSICFINMGFFCLFFRSWRCLLGTLRTGLQHQHLSPLSHRPHPTPLRLRSPLQPGYPPSNPTITLKLELKKSQKSIRFKAYVTHEDDSWLRFVLLNTFSFNLAFTTSDSRSTLRVSMGGNEGGRGSDRWSLFGVRPTVQKSPTDPGSDSNSSGEKQEGFYIQLNMIHVVIRPRPL